MKKSLIKTCLLLCFVLIISFCASCDKKCKKHEFVNGVCTKCEEVDPDYKTHTHEFIEGVCSCGEKDPEYKPHTHEFIEGVCVCGEKDPDYNPHTHEFVEGVCSCGEKDPNYIETYNIKYVLNGGSVSNAPSTYDGKVTITLPTPTHDYMDFFGWYDNPEFSGSPITEIPVGSKGDKVFYACFGQVIVDPIDNVNRFGFDGNGMNFGIMVPALSSYDPFDENYVFEDRALKQAHLTYIESAYNINISYLNFPNDAQWGQRRVEYFKSSFIDSSFQQKNVYSAVINSSWIPSLVKADCLVELYNMYEEDGLFNDIDIYQGYFVNDLVSVRNNVYGYNVNEVLPEYLIYYNVDKVKELGLEDPTELWFKGQWNYSKFDSWVNEAYSKLDEWESVIDILHGDYAIGMSTAQGNKICDLSRGRVLFAETPVCSTLEKMRSYYDKGIWNEKKGFQDVSTSFKDGYTLLQNGRLYFYTYGLFDDLEFTLGVVPYPSDDYTDVSLYLEPYEYENQNKESIVVDSPLRSRNGEVLTTSSGEEIYGINLSKSNYQCPITSINECYTIINYNYEYIGSINEKVVLNVLYDLTNHFSYKECLNSNEIYDKYHSELDKAAISSVINSANVYYEPIESIDFSIGYKGYEPTSWWYLCLKAMTSEETPKELLDQSKVPFQQELESIYKN